MLERQIPLYKLWSEDQCVPLEVEKNGHIRESSSNHIWKSVCDDSTVFLNLSHIGIHQLERRRIVKCNLSSLAVFGIRSDKGLTYNIFRTHCV